MNWIATALNCCRVAVLLCLSASATSAADGDGFRDDFETLDRDRWYVSSGWANGDHQSCLWHGSAVDNDDGLLLISLSDKAQGDRDYSCGEVQSKKKYGYGIYEARMKIPFASGVNANFFTFIGATQGRSHNEIDFEFITNPQQGKVLQTNHYTDGDGGNETFHQVEGAEAEYRTYAFAWAPELLRWYVDGKLIREKFDNVPAPPQKIYLSIWSTDSLGEWMGSFDGTTHPLQLKVDWVAYEPAGGECHFVQTVDCGT